MMNNKQIDEINNLLINHSDSLTAFYDEGIRYGLNRGCVVGAIGGTIGATIVYGIITLKSRIKKKEES